MKNAIYFIYASNKLAGQPVYLRGMTSACVVCFQDFIPSVLDLYKECSLGEWTMNEINSNSGDGTLNGRS